MNDATKMMTPAGIVAIPNADVSAREHRGCFKCDDQGRPLDTPKKPAIEKPAVEKKAKGK